jgi:GT2 family glycosyltransferase
MISLEEDKIEDIIDCRISSVRTLVSVIIVTYNCRLELVECLNSLKKQKLREFEVIVIDNWEGGKISSRLSDFNLNLQYIKLKKNYGPSIGRNIGICYAKTDIICFLDDDALAESHWTKAHYEVYQKYQIVGLRGKVLPKRDLIYNDLQSHYDLGSRIQESFVELEGNCSFRKDILIEVGGFNSKLFGGEGIELSYKIVNRLRDKSKLIYYPDVIIYHDYATGLYDYLEKCFRHEKMWRLLLRDSSDIYGFVRSYNRIGVNKNKRVKSRTKLFYFRRLSIFKLGRIAIRLAGFSLPNSL